MGFSISIGTKFFNERKKASAKFTFFQTGEGYICHFNNRKFDRDIIAFEDELTCVVLDGLITAGLSNEYEQPQFFINKFNEKGFAFISNLRGSFIGAIHEKLTNSYYIFTDHLSSKSIFYTSSNSGIFISSEIEDVYSYLRTHDLENKFSVDAAYMLLSYGYMLDDYTLSESIKKVPAGSYIKIKDNKLKVHRYYQLPKSTIDQKHDEDEMVERLDHLFRQAVKRQFEKDIQYGYKHLVTLSGGLDSRMTAWVANSLGYSNQLNITFSQSDYLDEKIAKSISRDLKHEWIFKSLDNGNFLMDIDEVTRISGGIVLYYTLAHGYSLTKYLNFSSFGVLHSGQLGDVVLGSYINDFDTNRLKYIGGTFSNRLLSKLAAFNRSFASFPDLENELIYQRGINGILSGLKVSQLETETLSPFLDIDFFEYCMSIPIPYRKSHGIYFKWISKKFPEAGRYIWEKSKQPIFRRRIYVKYRGNRIQLRKVAAIALQKLGISKAGSNSKHHMTPMNYWYANNPDLRHFVDTYFADNIELLNTYPELYSDCKLLFEKGSAIEKNQVLSLLAAKKLFF